MPGEALCMQALVHIAKIMTGPELPPMDAQAKADLSAGCRAPEAQTAAMQQQFRCSLEATDVPGLEACKAASDAMQPAPN